MLDALVFADQLRPGDRPVVAAHAADRDLAAVELLADGDGRPTATPIDLAIDVWRAAPEVVRAHHAEAIAMRQQNFEYFGPTQPVRGAFPAIDTELRQRLESEFDDWFESHRRGRGCRMFIIRHPPMTWILVRHGQPMRREASQKDDGGVGTEFYRPQRHDVLIYDERSGDIGVHASTKGERNLYLRTLGHHLFSGEEHFLPAGRFTFDPLIADGPEALNVEDVDGIKAVRLVEYRRYWGGVYRETETRQPEPPSPRPLLSYRPRHSTRLKPLIWTRLPLGIGSTHSSVPEAGRRTPASAPCERRSTGEGADPAPQLRPTKAHRAIDKAGLISLLHLSILHATFVT